MLLDCTDRNEKWYCQHGMIVPTALQHFFVSRQVLVVETEAPSGYAIAHATRRSRPVVQ